MNLEPRKIGRVAEVFRAFLLLGFTSFGGPVAHLGYFRAEFVERRKWLSEQAYADLVAICQFLPGPASSQVGFALGLVRGGGWGAVAAWLAFTLPSAIVLVLVALGASTLDGPIFDGIIRGLKLAAVAIVAHAVWGMARTLTPDLPRILIALASLGTVFVVDGAFGQVAAIALGALAGIMFSRAPQSGEEPAPPLFVSMRAGNIAGITFLALLVGLPLLVWLQPSAVISVVDSFYRAGALVFGGGHVVLPLLETEVVWPGWVTPDQFLTGYGVTQAVPGPLFTFAAYLGTVMAPLGSGPLGAALALVGIFLPGMLLLVAVLPRWVSLRRRPGTQALMRGANAAVVGLLAAALYNPVWMSGVHSALEVAIVVGGFVLLTRKRLPSWLIVLSFAVIGIILP